MLGRETIQPEVNTKKLELQAISSKVLVRHQSQRTQTETEPEHTIEKDMLKKGKIKN